ncbi:MAG: hypothetical protein FWC57_02240 [Endomicrobia bacterium]|nr:hypothetical protein [Endomicrobiia bacterium]
MPLFIIFGIIAAALFAATALLGMRRKFKYHKYFAAAAVFFMLLHIAGALGLY